MRIIFVVDDTKYFLPQWLDSSVEKLKRQHKIIGITPIQVNQAAIYHHIKKNIWRLGIKSISKLAIEVTKIYFGIIAFRVAKSNYPATIAQVAKKHRVNLIRTQNVNSFDYLKYIKSKNPDIIVSSCSQVFGNKLLSLPNLTCINRHSSLLPKYGGLLPIFQALLKQESEIGVSIHHMVKEIDKGVVISQRKIKIKKNDSLFFLYKLAYKESIPALISAIRKLNKNPKRINKTNNSNSSYYSYPTSQEWKDFINKGLKFI